VAAPLTSPWHKVKEALFGLGFLLAGLGFSAYGARAIYLNARARFWPLVEGHVTKAGTNYAKRIPTFELRYRYGINGMTYDGWTDDLSDELVDGHSIYAEGSSVRVNVDPDTPSRSFLKPAFHFPHLAWLVAGVLMVGTGLWMSWEELFGMMGLWPSVGRRFRRNRFRR